MLGIIKNKKFFLCLTVLGIFAFGSVSLAALNVDWPKSPMGTELKEGSLTITTLIKYLYEWGIGIAGFAVFIVLVFAGVEYLTSVGNASKMKDAMDRIKSAAFGLVLLLASVLILNTINPQLTVLKTPTFGIVTSTTLNLPLDYSEKGFEPCQKATLYEDSNLKTFVDFTNPPLLKGEIPLGDTAFGSNLTINSLKFTGDCVLLLYPSASPDEPIMIAGIGKKGREVKNIGRTYGEDTFTKATLSDVGGNTCPTLACLYENDEYKGLNMPISLTRTLDGTFINNEVSSVIVNDGYIAVLQEHDNFEGKCLKVDAPGIETLDNTSNDKPDDDTPILEDNMASAVVLLKASEDQTIPWGAIKLCDNASKDGGCAKGWTETITIDTLQVINNDGASRIELEPGYAAIIFGNADYEGDCRVITKTTDIGIGGHIKVDREPSSIQVMAIEGVEGNKSLFMY